MKRSPATHIGNTAAEEAAPIRRGRGRPRKSEANNRGAGNALIVAAARQFREKGFDATTTRDIAHSVGMQSGSPFYHFKSKNDLLFAIMEEGMLAAQRSQDAVLSGMAVGSPPGEVLYALALNHLRVLWLPGNDFVPVMLHEWRSITPAQRKVIQVMKDAYEEPWRSVLTELQEQGRLGTSASLARSMLFGILHGTLRWFDPKGPLGLEQLAKECVNAMVARQDHIGTRATRAGGTRPRTATDPGMGGKPAATPRHAGRKDGRRVAATRKNQ